MSEHFLDVADEYADAFPISDEEIAAFFDEAPGEPPDSDSSNETFWAGVCVIVLGTVLALAILIVMGAPE